ncbi:hypothetical protein [Arthrobacter sp. A5]|uniref:hypothetical protein n=1 Tax=Arthrobacter sp. A5 TaxID=576926 RepID=UPI003DA9ACBC
MKTAMTSPDTERKVATGVRRVRLAAMTAAASRARRSPMLLTWFTEALFGRCPIELKPSQSWTDDDWFVDQDNRNPRSGEGWRALQQGTGSGRIIGGNLCTINLLQGTRYMPPLDDALLMIEDD